MFGGGATEATAGDNVTMDGVPGASVSLEGVPGVDLMAGIQAAAPQKDIICSLPKSEEFAKEARACLFQDNFQGGKVDIQKPHSQNFATTHSLVMNPPGEGSDYAFGCNFFDTKLLMMGQVKNAKDMSATVRYEFTKRLASMFRMQVENGDEKRVNYPPFVFGMKDVMGVGGMDFMRMDLDYKGVNHVSNFNFQRVHHCAIPDQMGALSPLMSLSEDNTLEDRSVKQYQCQYSHTQHITEELCLGAALTKSYQFQGTVTDHDNSRAMGETRANFGFRYDPKDWVLTGSLSRSPKAQDEEAVDQGDPTWLKQFWKGSAFTFNTEYAHKVVDKEMLGGNSIWFATEYEVDPDLSGLSGVWAPSSRGSIGYMINLASAGIRQSCIKGKLTTEGQVTGTVEEHINPLVSMVMSASLDHAKEEYRFGFGLTVGGAM